jgi:transcriptional regulator with XRE-family HTH domain
MSQSHLSQIEGYDLVPNGVMLQRIAHRLGTTVEELIGEPDGNQPRDGVPHSSPAFQRNVQQAISSAINGMQTQIAADTIRPEIASITVEWRIDVERGTIDIHYHTVKHRE